MRHFIFAIFLIALLNSRAYCAGVPNEEEMFQDSEIVVDTGLFKESDEKRSFSISGEAKAVLEQALSRDWFDGKGGSDNRLNTYVLGDFYLDARLMQGTKYFGSVEVRNSSLDVSSIGFKESFMDFNLKRAVYIRAGKQVLQWGRCYLWNPSDLINIEKKTFIEKIGSRDGTFGIKAHAPFRTLYNLYGFWDLHGAKDLDETAIAGKFEYLVGGLEMAISVWHKKGYNTVYAYDLSSRLWGIDTALEAAVSDGDNVQNIKKDAGILSLENSNWWVPRISADLGRSFDSGDISDRITLNAEVYYNGGGYGDNIFKDKSSYVFSEPVLSIDDAGAPVPKTSGTKAEYLLLNGLYEPNYHSSLYGALFCTYGRFILSDITLNLNLIRNFSDSTMIATAGVRYADINDFSAGFNIYGFLGGPDGEYTFSGTGASVQIYAGVAF